MTIYGFCRISSGKSSISLLAQEQEIERILPGEPKKIIKCISSAYRNIPNDMIMFKNISNAYILFCAVDRFSRNVILGSNLAKKILENKNTIHFIRENITLKYAKGFAWDKFIEYLKQSEAESDNISNRVKMAKQFLKRNGYYTSSNVPIGFKKIKLLNGRYKLEVDKNIANIKRFVKFCRTPGTTVRTLNKQLQMCGADTAKDPLILNINPKKLETDLTYNNIADLLNDYSLGKRKWNSSMISRLYNTDNANNSINNNSTDANNSNNAKKYKSENHINKKRKLFAL